MKDMSIRNYETQRFSFNEDNTVTEADFIKILQEENPAEIEEAAQLLHDLLDVREKKIHEKSLKLVSGTIVSGRNKDGSFDVQPIGSIITETLENQTFIQGVWKGINNVSVFQNLEIGDEVIMLTISSGNKTNTMIIGVHEQKTKDKFCKMSEIMSNLIDEIDKLNKLVQDFDEYKYITDNRISQLNKSLTDAKTNINSLTSRISSLENRVSTLEKPSSTT